MGYMHLWTTRYLVVSLNLKFILSWRISGVLDLIFIVAFRSEGGIFNCKLIFPPTYPERPPKMKFTTPIWHPNVYTNGDVCISILHEPGEDAFNPQEKLNLFYFSKQNV
jgi:hypothetical protein